MAKCAVLLMYVRQETRGGRRETYSTIGQAHHCISYHCMVYELTTDAASTLSSSDALVRQVRTDSLCVLLLYPAAKSWKSRLMRPSALSSIYRGQRRCTADPRVVSSMNAALSWLGFNIRIQAPAPWKTRASSKQEHLL